MLRLKDCGEMEATNNEVTHFNVGDKTHRNELYYWCSDSQPDETRNDGDSLFHDGQFVWQTKHLHTVCPREPSNDHEMCATWRNKLTRSTSLKMMAMSGNKEPNIAEVITPVSTKIQSGLLSLRSSKKDTLATSRSLFFLFERDDFCLLGSISIELPSNLTAYWYVEIMWYWNAHKRLHTHLLVITPFGVTAARETYSWSWEYYTFDIGE